jgi:hypothetical protein
MGFTVQERAAITRQINNAKKTLVSKNEFNVLVEIVHELRDDVKEMKPKRCGKAPHLEPIDWDAPEFETRSGEPWSAREDKILRDAFMELVRNHAILHKRSEGAIMSRLEKAGYI